MLGGNLMIDWYSIQGGGGQCDTLSLFMLRKPGVNLIKLLHL